jgi:hypothetical protein
MNQKNIALAAIISAALLTGMFSTTPLAFAYDGGDESETNTEQELKQKNVGSGDSTNNNCGANLIEAVSDVECFNEEDDFPPGPPTTDSIR